MKVRSNLKSTIAVTVLACAMAAHLASADETGQVTADVNSPGITWVKT